MSRGHSEAGGAEPDRYTVGGGCIEGRKQRKGDGGRRDGKGWGPVHADQTATCIVTVQVLLQWLKHIANSMTQQLGSDLQCVHT